MCSRRESREAGLKDYEGEGERARCPKSGINLRTVAHSADRPQQQLTTVPWPLPSYLRGARLIRSSLIPRPIDTLPLPLSVFYSFQRTRVLTRAQPIDKSTATVFTSCNLPGVSREYFCIFPLSFFLSSSSSFFSPRGRIDRKMAFNPILISWYALFQCLPTKFSVLCLVILYTRSNGERKANYCV